jgi:hypothetical protein
MFITRVRCLTGLTFGIAIASGVIIDVVEQQQQQQQCAVERWRRVRAHRMEITSTRCLCVSDFELIGYSTTTDNQR